MDEKRKGAAVERSMIMDSRVKATVNAPHILAVSFVYRIIMALDDTNYQPYMASSTSYPIGSTVILRDLVKGAQYNGMKGTVKSLPDPTTKRQNIYVHPANKSLAVKPSNLRYERRELTSLSIDEMRSLLVYFGLVESHETTAIIKMEMAGKIEQATGALQTLVRERIVDDYPEGLAWLLAAVEEKQNEFTAKCREASDNGPSYEKAGLPHPCDYLKGRYKQHAKRDAKEDEKQCCNGCGKTNIKLSKCARCLSVFYCSKQCQHMDYVTHKKECKNLLQERKAASRSDVDMVGIVDNTPCFGVALSESITGVHGEVICHLPCWIVDGFETMTRSSFDARKFARSIRYFFKVYQSSAEAAKSLSVKDVGGLCEDAIILYWLKYPGVRIVYDAKEANSGEFTLDFVTFMEKPDGWSIVGFEDRFAKIME